MANKPAPTYKAMHKKMMEGLQRCPYSLEAFQGKIDLSNTVEARTETATLLANVRNGGEGAFSLVGRKLIVNMNGETKSISLTPEQMKMSFGEFLKALPSIVPGFVPRIPILAKG